MNTEPTDKTDYHRYSFINKIQYKYYSLWYFPVQISVFCVPTYNLLNIIYIR